MKKQVLFVCARSSSLSQMAAAMLNQLCGKTFEAHSASFEPREPSPLVMYAMSESGLDISDKQTKAVSGVCKSGQAFDIVITLSDEIRALCDPIPAATARLHWGFRDPSDFHGSHEYKLNCTRDIRDSLEAAIAAWCGRACPESAAHAISFKPFYSQKLNTGAG